MQKVTGNDLKYAVMMGKPSEFTFRYAEYVVSLMARKLGYKRPINRLYMLGDNPLVDIVGANLYSKYLRRCRRRASHMLYPFRESDLRRVQLESVLAPCRRPPESADLGRQTVESCEGTVADSHLYEYSTLLAVH